MSHDSIKQEKGYNGLKVSNLTINFNEYKGEDLAEDLKKFLSFFHGVKRLTIRYDDNWHSTENDIKPDVLDFLENWGLNQGLRRLSFRSDYLNMIFLERYSQLEFEKHLIMTKFGWSLESQYMIEEIDWLIHGLRFSPVPLHFTIDT